MGQLELARPLLPRLVGAHQLQRHPLARQRLTVEGNEGPGGPFAAKVDGLRQLGLAHLLFTAQQDRPLTLGRLSGVAQQLAHGARFPHQCRQLGHRLAQLVNGPQPVDRMQQGDKADPLRLRQRLEAYQRIDELPGMHPEPLQGHLHMTERRLPPDGQLQPLGQQQVLLQGLAEAERRIEPQSVGRQRVEVAQPALRIPGQHAVIHAVEQGVKLAQMVLGLLHQALHLQQMGQLATGADGERQIPDRCLLHPADQGHDGDLTAVAVVDRAGAAVPGVQGLVEMLGAADAERHSLQRRQIDGIGADAPLAKKSAGAKAQGFEFCQRLAMAGTGQHTAALVGEQQGAGAPLHEFVEILEGHFACGEQVPLALAQALQGLPLGTVGRMPEGGAGLVGAAQPGGLQIVRAGLGRQAVRWHCHCPVRQACSQRAYP
ncbi:hypothetical protein D3C75_647540 [compost metagenome]